MLNDKSLILFFTTGMSLEKWARFGNLSREVELYNKLAESFKNIYFVTYGSREKETNYRYLLADNITILHKRITFLPDKIYTLLIPFLYADFLGRVDYIKTNQMPGSLSALIAKLIFKKQLIIRCGYEFLKNNISRKVNFLKIACIRLYEKLVYFYADKIIVSSEGDKIFIISELGIVASKVFVIPNYVNTDVFKPMGISKDRGRICYVGRLNNNEKNLKNLVMAMSEVPASLVLIGDGEYGEDLKSLGMKHKVALKMLGCLPNDQLPLELNKAEIFVLPSFFEGCPKALLEAMSCGLACIGTNVDGIKQIIQDGENGLLCETDALSIRKAMADLLSADDLRSKLGHNARETIVNKFSIFTVVSQELDLYHNGG